ncbi:MAG: trypsin-like peptidase domain-containing protein [Defluviitaleaceae bacterium]|nr:trypsin-like peptidase domain-containing protein [Defluviitaleaceae bacterium]MCL2264131.1 trypsin-like peptidase domain-containing protein [Defluviitaleaceae bacterium]
MEQKSSRGGKILLFIFAFCIGGAALGIGLGVGNAVALHFLPEVEIVTEVVLPADAAITTVRVNPLVVPVDPQEPSFVDIIPEAKAAVVSISVTGPIRSFGRGGDVPGSGSGFIFAKDDEFIFIATNNHVIENTTTIAISLDDTENIPASVVGYDRASDVAVIVASRAEMEEKNVPFTVARLGDSDALRMGDSVIAIGNAMGEGQTVTRGIISALSLSIEIPDARERLSLDVLQTDAAVNRGNSGGPLINRHGEVIGIVTAKLIGADIEGMGYALPINDVRPLLEDIMETGSVRRTWLGIEPEDVSEFFRSLFNLPSTGVLVRAVMEDSPAEEGGLLQNDLIIRFNERRISNTYDLQSSLYASRPGDTATLQIYRDGIQLQVSVVLGSRMH